MLLCGESSPAAATPAGAELGDGGDEADTLSDMTRLPVSFALFLATACKTSAPPAPLAQVQPAAVSDWGEVAARTEHNGAPCLTFSEVVVALKDNRIKADTTSRATGCALSDAAVVLEGASFDSIEGAAGPLVFTARSSFGNVSYVKVIDVTVGAVVLAESLELSQTPSLDLDRRVLRYSRWPGVPDGCAPESADFSAWREGCWPVLQASVPALAGVEAPECSCPEGLDTVMSARFERSLDDLSVELGPLPPFTCDCSP